MGLIWDLYALEALWRCTRPALESIARVDSLAGEDFHLKFVNDRSYADMHQAQVLHSTFCLLPFRLACVT